MLGAALLRLLGRTWRIERREGPRPFPEPSIFAFWHSGLLALAFLRRGEGAAVLVSRHRDGEWIARTLEGLGFVTARGSSTRGGGAGTIAMLRRAAEGRSLGITPDGPRGPVGRAKPGVIRIARASGLPIVPVIAAPRNAWVLRSWDRFQVPKPFTPLALHYGAPLVVPRDLPDAAVETWCRTLEAALDELGARARGSA
jgi:lysophospholipid acyltransferase (LPLAT)-like uncharacterized protein